jgi:hypothetical protein
MKPVAITPSSGTIISNLNESVETLFTEIQQIHVSSLNNTGDATWLEKLETEVHAKTARLADLISAIKLQQALESEALVELEKELVKSQPKKMKNMGWRSVIIRFLGGSEVTLSVPYYHQKSVIKKQEGKKGFYPRLVLLGIHERCTSALLSRVSLFATASCSFEEAKRLMGTLYGFALDIKSIRRICRHFAMRARSSFEAGEIALDEEFKGKRVVVSTDGGRVRTRVNKPGKKTKKNRRRYKTDWREPKLILVYVVNEAGEKDRKIPPVMDASLEGPDATFGMLLYYLKKLGVQAADQLLFVSDGAVWIWDRVVDLITKLGIQAKQCLLALDFYHAVEHLTSIGSEKQWDRSRAKKWVAQQRKRLLQGKLDQFMQEIERVCHATKNKLLNREREYFKHHLPHMRYKEIKDQKLPIGSGAVESGIRRVINLRLKGPGIFWHEDMVDAMLLLRSYYKAGRWNLLENMAFQGGMILD